MNHSQIYRIKGMHCASCANIIEKTFKKIEGVESVEINYGTETAKVSLDESKVTPHDLSKKIETFGYSLDIPKVDSYTHHSQTAVEMGMSEDEHAAHLGLNQSREEKLAEIAEMQHKLISVIPLAIFSIIIMVWDVLAQINFIPAMPYVWEEFFHHLLPIFATYTLFVIGKPYLRGLYYFIRYGKANMDTLIGIGTVAAFIYSFVLTAFEDALRPYLNVDHTYYDVAIVVIAFITLGKYLEARSKIKTGDAIEKLLNLQVKTALVVRDGHEVEIAISEVRKGDVIIIKPASKIPVDGVVCEGSSFVDESMISGEPIPIEKNTGDAVVAGTLNTSGTFTFEATKVGSETLLAHIIKMVTEAQSSKAPIQKIVDKISAVFVPTVVVVALVTLIAWLVIGTFYVGFAQALSYALVSFIGVLVIACPCALGLATPTAIIVGVGKGAREGILVKDAATLEKLYQVTTVVVDKTGTITKGKPEVTTIRSEDMSERDVVRILTTLESRSEHPIAQAITFYAKEKGIRVEKVTNFEILKGEGVKGAINGVEYFAGNAKLITDLKLSVDTEALAIETRQGKTPIILATHEKMLATIFVSDAIKPEAKEAVAQLHKLGIKIIMLTGDNANTARYIADQVGIDEVIAEVLPQDKLEKIRSLQATGVLVAMAGDGVNDAPALAQADVGIAMSTGTDVAIESAGITLLGGDISKLLKAITLSKLTMRGIKQNLFWAFIYNIVGIPLAAGVFYPVLGWLLSPIFAGLAMAFSSVSVVLNSLRLKTKKL